MLRQDLCFDEPGKALTNSQLAPAQFLVTARTNEALGSHCLEFTNPSFRQRVKDGFDIIVAGKAFGCGSSREQAVNALLGKHSSTHGY
mgnify:CR=1 FL=1